jgi:hypothetical protein
MPILVHLAPEQLAARIRKNGIRATDLRHTDGRGVYCMPITPSYYASYQWLRELKRGGHRTFAGVHFRLRSDESVWVGHYGREHHLVPVGRAIRLFLQQADPRGYQFVVPRRIEPDEIVAVREVSQVVGWRYYPGAHGKRPTCDCPFCLPLGSIKSRKLRERIRS